MRKFRDFIERNEKIFRVVLSFISVMIIGLFGTIMSINNSITARTSLELAKANSQPAFDLKLDKVEVYEESNLTNVTEYLNVNVENGFCENVRISNYVWIEYKYNIDGKSTIKKYIISDYFANSHYSGKNRGIVAEFYYQNNRYEYDKLLVEFELNDDYDGLTLNMFSKITYKDILGNDSVRYYKYESLENNNHLDNPDFDRIDSQIGEDIIKDIAKLTEIKLDDLTIEKLTNL